MAKDKEPTTPTPATAETSKQSSAQPTGKPKSNLKKILLIVILGLVAFFVVVIVGIFIAVNFLTTDAVKVSDTFVSAMQNGDADTAYAQFSEEAVAVVPKDQFTQLVDQVDDILTGEPSNTNKSIEGETGSAAQSQVVYEIAGSDGKTYVVTVNLVKQDDDWKVLNFESDEK